MRMGEWITETSACLVGIWVKRKEEYMTHSTDKCHEAFPNQTLSGFVHIIISFLCYKTK